MTEQAEKMLREWLPFDAETLEECRITREHTSITQRQRLGLVLIVESMIRRGNAPTQRELARAIGARSNTSGRILLDAVEDKGWILRVGAKPRIVGVVDPRDGKKYGQMRDA
tara:strand:- start:215 stop:550 length:336 start_codon:yes stop_codon:yes gene_type:complete